jgi:hypothetical protein
MSAVTCLDNEIRQRDLLLLNAETTAKVRRLCRHPHTGADILHERLLNGCAALDQKESDYRWQLFELILAGWECCQIEQERQRREIEAHETWLIRNDPQRQRERRTLAALNYQSLNAYLVHEARKEGGARQVAPQRQKRLAMTLRVT